MWDELESVFCMLDRNLDFRDCPPPNGSWLDYDRHRPETRAYTVDINGLKTKAGLLSVTIEDYDEKKKYRIVTTNKSYKTKKVHWLPWSEGEFTTHKLNGNEDYWFITATLSGCIVGFSKEECEIFHINGSYAELAVKREIQKRYPKGCDLLCPLSGRNFKTLNGWAEAQVRPNEVNQYGKVTHYGSIIRKQSDANRRPGSRLKIFRDKSPKYSADMRRATVIGKLKDGVIHLIYQDISEMSENKMSENKVLFPWYEIAKQNIF
ncbi:hypothetical protein ACJJIK_02125 [Microbulbifer sp. ZKSA006]|uniref:hypothetical protein n=1 Tax=Microbulbifer sp. ZKSA006 TaxID=3243390 RepID=UPI004039F44F